MNSVKNDKKSGTLMASLYKEYAQSWDTCVSMLTFLILICSKEEECGLVSKPVWVH